MKSDFPDDSDGQALQMMVEKGMDMARSANFEFSIHVEDERSSEIVLERLKAAGLGDACTVIYDEGELEEGEEMTEENEQFWPSWTVCVYRDMLPSYEGVVEFQKILADICGEAGNPDGWTLEID